MIAGQFFQGSGMGNQLARYVMTRVLALDKEVDFGMIGWENFKGKDFMNLDKGVEVKGLLHEYHERSKKNGEGNEVRGYDWTGILNVHDFTLIDGEFQGEEYYEHHLDRIQKWLQVEPLEMPDDLCVISHRGGEYVMVKDLYLPWEYWDMAIRIMKDRYPNIRFEVQTDDPVSAGRMFPDFKIIHDIGYNWRAIRYAKHLIVSNSSFSILPSLLGDAKEIIAPKYHAGYNKGYWQLQQNFYKRYTYIHHEENSY